jgi:hypothetical protein
MYLPVLMIRDFGAAGWLVFAIPNVIGAAAMGWALSRPGAAAELSRRHWPAAVCFSVVTILFHAFFVGWLIRALVGDAAEVIVAAAAIAVYLIGRRGNRDLLTACALLLISLIAFVVAACLPDRQMLGPTATMGTNGLFYLAPVCVFGFLLCPYLDLTFLRARAATAPFAGIAAFTIGFGIFFLAMILFTFWYARLLEPSVLRFVPRALAWVIAVHMMLQSALTIALHARAVAEDRRAGNRSVVAGFFAALLAAFFVGVWCRHVAVARPHAGEMVYRLFISFYGLIVPAYVWLCMIPARSAPNAPASKQIVALAITVLVVAPMYGLAFFGNDMRWLAPGLVIVLAARYVREWFHKIPWTA